MLRTNLFRFQTENVVPDILLVGKGLWRRVAFSGFYFKQQYYAEWVKIIDIGAHHHIWREMRCACAAGLASLQKKL